MCQNSPPPPSYFSFNLSEHLLIQVKEKLIGNSHFLVPTPIAYTQALYMTWEGGYNKVEKTILGAMLLKLSYDKELKQFGCWRDINGQL